MAISNPLSAPTTPGVAGPASSGQPVVYDPSTGLYVNQTTGAVSSDPAGQHPVQNPSLATQAARNISVSNNLMAKLATYGQGFQSANAGQDALVGNLQKTINGTAPTSVAQTQLVTGLDSIKSAENSQAAGATGANAALARQNAQLGIAQAGAKENQDAAGLRATEVTNAENTEAGVLGNEANENAGLYGTNLQGATAASGQAGTEEGAKESADQTAQTAQNNAELNLVSGVGQAAVKAASDPKVKKNVKKLDDSAIKKFTKKLAGFSFDYKTPGASGQFPGHRVGIMADQVEKGGPIGKALVSDGPVKKLDLVNAIGANLAVVGHLAKQIEELKKSKKKAA